MPIEFPVLIVKNVSFSYSESPVLEEVSFQMGEGKIVCLLGESGSGKSTLLKLIYGLHNVKLGQIIFEKELVRGPDTLLVPGHPDMKYVSQDFDLDEFITVSEIIGKHLSNIYRKHKKERVQEVLHAFGLEDFAQKTSRQLSGGQQQRVAIARALANPPKMLILDEPFGQLDASLHAEVRSYLMSWVKENNITMLFSTHEAKDAMAISDEMILIKEGKIIQQGTPKEIYQNPVSAYAAKLLSNVNIMSFEWTKSVGIEIAKNEESVIYPDEIKVDKNSELTCKVQKSTYIGREYVITANCNGEKTEFYHLEPAPIGTKMPIKILNYRTVKN